MTTECGLKSQNKNQLLTHKFLEKTFCCINDGLQSIHEKEKRIYLGKRFQYLIGKLAIYLDNYPDSHEVVTTIRNLVYTFKYFEFTKFVKKYFKIDTHRFKDTSEVCVPQRDRCHCHLEAMFVQFYRNCIITSSFVELLIDFDLNFTSKMENHLQNGIYFVPCISLFKEYDNFDGYSEHVSKKSWLNIVFQYLSTCGIDDGKRLPSLFNSFVEKYNFNNNNTCHADFFCTILIPVLDDVNLISCLNYEYNFLLFLTHMVAAVIGKSILLERFIQVIKTETQKHKLKYFVEESLLFPSCYDLISIKPNNKMCVLCQPTKALIANVPYCYGYDQKNFPNTGILSQLFLFSSGAKVDIVTETDALIISANDLLCRLPEEWKNLIAIYRKNYRVIQTERKNSTFTDIASSTYVQASNDTYFSILANDAYMALYYVSRILSYYLNISHFDSEEHLYELYDTILEEVLKSPVKNIIEAAEQIIFKLGTRIKIAKSLPDCYQTPEEKNVLFDFFSNTGCSNAKPVTFYKVSQQNSMDLVQCGVFTPPTQNSIKDKSSIQLILFLSTVLNVKNSINVKPFLKFKKAEFRKYESLLSNMQFLDKNFYIYLIYNMTPKQKGYMAIHIILQPNINLHIISLTFGILRLLCIIKRPRKPTSLLLQIISKWYSGNTANVDVPLHEMILHMYFTFKKLNELCLFYPILMGVSFAYGGIQFLRTMKELLTETFGCNASLLKLMSRKELIEWNVLLNERKMTETDENLGICYHFNNIMSNILANSENTDLRICDLLYFIIHLKPPFRFANYCVSLPIDQNGFEFYTNSLLCNK